MANNLTIFKAKGNVPTNNEINILWDTMKLEKNNNWTIYTEKLIETINNLYSNGGIMMNKYKIMETNPMYYYLIKRKDFVQNIYKNKIILEDKAYLKLNGELPKINIIGFYTDIYTLAGDLARIIGYGGAYSDGVEQNEAWKIAVEFVENEFENRFEEYNLYKIKIENTKWFRDVAWDYSFIIVDKKNYEIIFMDMTDTD